MTFFESAYFAALVVGVLGAGHCIGMCGGIATAMSAGISARPNLSVLLGYNTGRILSYSSAGAIAGWIGGQVNYHASGVPLLSWLSAIMLLLMGLYLADIWRGLVHLERFGGMLWQYLRPLSKPLIPVKHFPQAVALGLVWGWLPCGLIYSALSLAAVSGSWQAGGLTMLFFGLGTLPTLVTAGLAAQRISEFLKLIVVRRLMACVMVLLALMTFLEAGRHSHHNHGSMNDNPEHHHSH